MPETLNIVVRDEGRPAGGVPGGPPGAVPGSPEPGPGMGRPGVPAEIIVAEAIGRAQQEDTTIIADAVSAGAQAGVAAAFLTGPIGRALAAAAGALGAGRVAFGLGAVVGTLESLGITVAGAVIGIGALTAAAGLSVAALRRFGAVVVEQTEALAGLSPEISLALAERQAALELARIRRAEEIGPELAGLTRARTAFDLAMFELQTRLLESVLGIARIFEPFIEVADGGIEAITTILEVGVLPALEAGVKTGRSIFDIGTALARWALGQVGLAGQQVDPFVQQFLDMVPAAARQQGINPITGQPIVAPGV